jgi:hypothetical protein
MSADVMSSAAQTSLAAELLAKQGYLILRELVPSDAVERALRHIHLDVVRRGLPLDDVSGWLWSAHWFPHLKWDTPVAGLVEYLPGGLRDGELCDPQIVVQPPDDCADVELVSHVDAEPDWARGRPYRRIVGIALTRADAGNGGLVVWPFDGHPPTPLQLAPGDAVVMHPRLPHSSGLNREGAMRYAVYFRFLEP